MARSWLAGWCLFLYAVIPAWAGEKEKEGKGDAKTKDAIKEVAGTAEFLRNTPKKFAVLESFDLDKRVVRLRVDGEKEAKEWRLTPDAEIKVNGWWGRLDDLPRRCKVWAWFHVNRKKTPVSIFMLADEISEQDIHGNGLEVLSLSADGLQVKDAYDKKRDYPRPTSHRQGGKEASVKDIKPGDKIFLSGVAAQEGDPLYHACDAASFEALRQEQRKKVRERWTKQGLPGVLGFVHVYSGEADLILDHEAMRWARSLKPGDKVQLPAEPAIQAVVKGVSAQREKTQLRLVIHSLDLAEWAAGQRVRLLMKPPAADVEASQFPPDIDLPRSKGERIEWFLANMYCTCGVGGDRCTGHFYTLAGCNPNACGLPNATRKELSTLIDQGLTNRQIFERLLEDRGPTMLRPHLRP